MENLTVTRSLMNALEALRLDLTHYLILREAKEGKVHFETLCHRQTLQRKEFMVGNVLTDAGKLLLEQLEGVLHVEVEEAHESHADLVKTVRKALAVTREEEEAALELFNKAYPSSTTWYDDNGKKWEGGRSLKTPGKKQLAPKFFAALREVYAGGRTITDIIAALEHDIANKKRKSAISGRNEMDYMPAWGVFVNQRRWEGIWDEMAFEQEKRPLSTGKRPVDTTHLF